MKTVVFFQPYIKKWRYDFLRRFINENNDKYNIYSLYGKNKNNVQSDVDCSMETEINAKGLYAVPLKFKFKKQDYPVYFSPLLFLELIKISPDIIVTEGEINIFNNITIWIYCKLFKRKYLWWSLGKVRTRKTNIINKIANPIMNNLLRDSKYIMARNSYAKKYYIEQKGILENKVIIAPNSLDEESIDQEIQVYKEDSLILKEKLGNRKTILFSGKIVKGKRLEDLIDAIESIKYEIENILLLIIGDGPEKENIISYVQKKKLEKNVMFLGAVYEDVSKYFLASDLVVLPGMGGLVIYHAMVHSKPIITRIADGVEDDLVINDYNGFIMEDYDNEKLANRIRYILNSDDILTKMGKNSRKIIDEKWNMKLMIQAFIQAIEY